MALLNIVLLCIRVVQALFAVIVLGLTGHGNVTASSSR